MCHIDFVESEMKYMAQKYHQISNEELCCLCVTLFKCDSELTLPSHAIDTKRKRMKKKNMSFIYCAVNNVQSINEVFVIL